MSAAMIPADITCLDDYERHAARRLPDATWRHIQQGSGRGLTLAADRAALDAIRLLPRVLADVRDGSTAIDLFGERHATPILLAPVAYQRLAHADGELATIRAATALDVAMVVSTLASVSLEDIAAAAQGAAAELRRPAPPRWFQLYVQPGRDQTAELVRRAEAAGYSAIMVTVDASLKRSAFALPPGLEAANLRGGAAEVQEAVPGGPILFGTPLVEQAPTWDDLAWLRTAVRGPLIVKGVLSPDDARRAVDLGADGLVVSNHGGRVFDAAPAALAALPAIAAAVGPACPLIVDGAIRSGLDVLKVLACGARAVLVGRPQYHALAVAGTAGVAHMLHLLRAEFELALALAGRTDVAAIGEELLFRPAGPSMR